MRKNFVSSCLFQGKIMASSYTDKEVD